MGIFGRKRIKKIEDRNLPLPRDVEEIEPPVQRQPAEIPREGYAMSYPQPARVQSMPSHPSVPSHPRGAPTSYPPQARPPSQPPSRAPPTKKRDVEQHEDVEEPQLAPLFIKLTRYRNILNNINYLKMSVNLIRHQLLVLNELDKLKSENMKLLQSTMEKVNERLLKLDSEFMRPAGFMEEIPGVQLQELESLENTITDLRTQIEGLKQEVETLS